MPTYEFRCKKCKHVVEVVRKYEECRKVPEYPCPQCQSCKWEKILSKGIMMHRGPKWGGSKGNWGKA